VALDIRGGAVHTASLKPKVPVSGALFFNEHPEWDALFRGGQGPDDELRMGTTGCGNSKGDACYAVIKTGGKQYKVNPAIAFG